MPKTASELGITAPSGGFQNLGWYPSKSGGSYQYLNGTFGESGAIHPDSPQVGAGQKVSSEVNQQSDVAQGYSKGTIDAYLNNGSVPSFKGTDDAQNFLNGVQNSVFQNTASADYPQVQSTAEILNDVKDLLPTDRPEVISLTDTFSQLRTDQGVESLEEQLLQVKAEEEALIAQKRIRTNNEIAKPEAMNVISGRVSEVERQENEKLDIVLRKKNALTNELNVRYNVINTMMELTQQDYSNAVNDYNSRFTQAIDTINLVQGIRRDQLDEAQMAINNARANLQIYTNLLTDGGVSYADLSGDQKLQINKLEAMAGLPVGLMSNIKKNEQEEIVFTTSNEGITQIGLRSADGSIRVEQYGTRISSTKMTEAETYRSAQSSMGKQLSNVANDYGHVSPEQYNYARSQWVNAGYDPNDFDSVFRTYRDPNRTDNAYNIVEDF